MKDSGNRAADGSKVQNRVSPIGGVIKAKMGPRGPISRISTRLGGLIPIFRLEKSEAIGQHGPDAVHRDISVLIARSEGLFTIAVNEAAIVSLD